MIPIGSLILISLGSLLTSVISAVCGMGGGIVLLSIMTFFLPLKIIVPIHGVVQLISNSFRTYLLRRHIILPIFYSFCVGLPFGIFLAVKIIKTLDSPLIPLLIIVGLIFYSLFKPKKLPPLKIPFWGFSFVGFGVGLLGPLVGATGPFIAPFFLRPDFSKENIVATKASVQMVGHLVKIPAFLYLGFSFQNYWVEIGIFTLMTLIGTKLGVLILGKIEQRYFVYIYKTVLFFAGLRVLYKVIT